MVYDSSDRQVSAYRAGWLMRILNLVPSTTTIKVLDGGYKKWLKEARTTESCTVEELHGFKKDDEDI